MRNVIALFLALFAVACGPVSDVEYEGDPQENAVHAFTQTYGAPSETCERRALDAEVTTLSLGDTRLACNDHVVGCVTWPGDSRSDARIVIAEEQDPGVLAHETLHILLICSGKLDDNNGHRGSVWHLKGIH